MLPLGQVQPWQTNPHSAFPQVWLLERSAIIAQMLYHITRIMLIETDPLRQDHPADMQHDQQHHAINVCGIVSNDRNSGIPIFSPYFLAVAADYLIDRKAQEEALAILNQMPGTTGMNTDHIREKLQQKWNWDMLDGHQPLPNNVDSTVSIEFSTSDPSHGFLQAGLDPFAHSLTDSHPYLDHHHTFDHH
jgi:hypothetical protein